MREFPNHLVHCTFIEHQEVAGGLTINWEFLDLLWSHLKLLHYKVGHQQVQTHVITVPWPKLVGMLKRCGKNKPEVDIISYEPLALKGLYGSEESMPGDIFPKHLLHFSPNDASKQTECITICLTCHHILIIFHHSVLNSMLTF